MTVVPPRRSVPILAAAMASLAISAAPAFAGSDGSAPPAPPAPAAPVVPAPVAPAPPPAPAPAPAPAQPGTPSLEQTSPSRRRGVSVATRRHRQTRSGSVTSGARARPGGPRAPWSPADRAHVSTQRGVQQTSPQGGVQAGAGGMAPQGPDGALPRPRRRRARADRLGRRARRARASPGRLSRRPTARWAGPRLRARLGLVVVLLGVALLGVAMVGLSRTASRVPEPAVAPVTDAIVRPAPTPTARRARAHRRRGRRDPRWC